MKRILSICYLIVTFFLAGNTFSMASNYVYSLDIDIPNPGLITETEAMIGLIQFQMSGGIFGSDWDLQAGNAVPAVGNWGFEKWGSWYALYDNYNYSEKNYTPLLSGNALVIMSDVELNFTNLGFFDFAGDVVDPQYFTTQGFVEQNSVPIPGGIILLGSGLIGLLGLKRRK